MPLYGFDLSAGREVYQPLDFASRDDLATRATATGLRWIPVGDSLTSPQGGGAPDMGWTAQASMLSDGQLAEHRNAGITGNNAADVRARLQADVIAHAPNLVSVWVGVNDVTQSRTLAAYQADVTAILDALAAAGITPVLLTIPPRTDTTKHATIARWNLWLRTLAQARRINLVDAYAALVDPATGGFKAGHGHTDAIHLTQTGHNAIARLFVTTMAGRLPAGGVLRPRLNIDANNLLANGLLLDNDDASPGVPDSWLRAGGTTGVVEALVDDADFFGGRAWEVAMTTPTTAPQFLQSATTGWAAGDDLLFVIKVKVVAATGVGDLKGLRINANFFGAAAPTSIVARYLRLPGLQGLIAKRFTVPAGTTGPVQLACIYDVDTTATATYRVGEAAVYNLTQLGLAA